MKAKYYLGVLAAFLIFCGRASAITLGVPDCQDNASNTGCQHPNVVSLAGFTVDPVTQQLVSFGRCSGSLLKVTPNMLIIVTAGHCAEAYSQNLASGAIVQLGVSFDALIQKLPDSVSFGSSQYLLGGQPLIYDQYGLNGSQFDYGLIAFPLQSGVGTTDGGNIVNVAAINPVILPPLDFLNSFETQVTTITSVGYGLGSVFTETGKRITPPSSANYEDLGVREIADRSVFIGFHGKNQNLMLISQNLAQGNNGTCNGDSGGPQFYKLNGQELIISVTSTGDRLCRATNITARLDIAEAQNFIQQCGYAANSMQQFANCNLGCTTVNSKGTCAN